VRGLPHAFREIPAESGESVVIDISGPAGGTWTLLREVSRWTLFKGEPSSTNARIRLTDDSAWKLLFNALADDEAARAVDVDGRAELGDAFLRARSVIV